MAAPKFRNRPVAGKIARHRPIRERDPQTWLACNPDGVSPTGLTFGVLRQDYAGRRNSALEFGWRKAHLGPQPVDADWSAWSPNAERVEVILPAAADDSLGDPATLLMQMDACVLARGNALLIYMTLPLGDVERVHVGWERARAFARDLARDRQLATLVLLHAPGTINERFPLHAHCLVLPRRISGLGLRQGIYDDELIGDGGQKIIEARWAEHRATFR